MTNEIEYASVTSAIITLVLLLILPMDLVEKLFTAIAIVVLSVALFGLGRAKTRSEVVE